MKNLKQEKTLLMNLLIFEVLLRHPIQAFLGEKTFT
jgi:hypothetical protein